MPSLKHSADLHYVRAFLYEVLRYVTVGSAATKAAYKDSYFKGYFIPKHTTVSLYHTIVLPSKNSVMRLVDLHFGYFFKYREHCQGTDSR